MVELLGIGGIPKHRTSATRWLIKAEVPIVKLEGDARRPEAVKLSDLPAEVRRAVIERDVAAAGLPLGTYDEAAHQALAQATPKMRDVAERKAAIARDLMTLVHRPNLHLTALNAQEPVMPPDTAPNPAAEQAAFISMVIELFGLPPNTPLSDAAAMLKAKREAMPDPGKYMPVAAVHEMLADRLAERRATDQGRAQEKVRVAIQQRYITPGMRDWALALCQSDEGSFDAFLTKVGPVFAYLGGSSFKADTAKPAHLPHEPRPTDLEAAMCEQLGLPPGSLSR